MDWAQCGVKLKGAVYQYKYVILVLLIGIILMVVPSGRQTGKGSIDKPVPTDNSPQEYSIERQLEEILSGIQGAGKVKILLTAATGQETIYQSDQESDSGSESSSLRRKTVVITNENRSQQGLVRQVNPPKYMGAIIVCQGADQAQVKLAMIEAVADATGLGTDRISVLKMK